MNDNFLRAAKSIGFKSPLQDPHTFVGRKREILKLEICCTGKQVTSTWIWGPRRIGKTSLSYRITEFDNIYNFRINCDKHQWENFDKFCDFIKIEINNDGKTGLCNQGYFIFDELAKISNENKHIIVILDEFDLIGINLQKFEQAYIRSILQKYPYFGLIFISRLNPLELLQDYSDENSRLIGVCDIIRVPFLEKSDIFDLTKYIELKYNITIKNLIVEWIYKMLSGYSVAIQFVLREILLLAAIHGQMPNESQIENNSDDIYFKLNNELKGIWHDLSLDLKKHFLNKNTPINSATKREMLSLNLINKDKILIPLWIEKIGKEIGLSVPNTNLPNFIGIAEKIIQEICFINEISLKKGFPAIFQVTQQTLHIFEIARPVENLSELNDKIGILHKICVENTNSNDNPGKDKCLIPTEYRSAFKKSWGFLTIVAWRNFSFHDPSHDLKPGEESSRYKNIGEIYCKYLGPNCYTANNKNDLNIIYKGILNDVCDAITQLGNTLRNT
jgi:hypothetical protein